jgi:hypothetical protein
MALVKFRTGGDGRSLADGVEAAVFNGVVCA